METCWPALSEAPPASDTALPNRPSPQPAEFTSTVGTALSEESAVMFPAPSSNRQYE